MTSLHTTRSERISWVAFLLLAAILIIAALLRFARLDYAPSGGHGDVAWIGINALDWVDRGIWPFYVRELYAPEPFPVYLTGLLLPLTGISYLPQRIVTATFGVLFVAFLFPATWWLLAGRSARFRTNAALFAALAGAVNLHVVALSRLGMESPPFLTVLTLLIWLTARAWRRGGYWNWAAAGVVLALAQYVFLAARLLPIVLALWIVHAWWSDRDRLKVQWRGWLAMGVVSFLLTLPALILFIRTPEAFSARADAGTAQTGGWIWQFDTSAYGGPLGLIVQKIGLTLLALGFEWHGPYNIMNLPMLAPLFFLGFVVAVPIGLRRFHWIAYGWTLLALPVMWLTDLISGAVLEVHALHQMGALPFVYILSGLGLAHGWQFTRDRLTKPAGHYTLFFGVTLFALLPAYVWMDRYLNDVIPAQYADPSSGWARAQTDVDLGQYLNAHADQAFLLPYTEYNRSDVAWVTAQRFRQRLTAVNAEGMLDLPNLPPQLTVVFTSDPERPRHDGFPSYFDPRLWVLLLDDHVWLLPPLTNAQEDQLLRLHNSELGTVLVDRSQTEIAQFYSIESPAEFLSPRAVVDHPVDAVFGDDEIRLLGYTLPDENLTPGSVVYVSLFWQALRPPTQDYEVFVQFWADDQTSIGGAHDFPYGGMYRSRIWRTDEVVVTHHWIEVPEDVPVGRYTLAAGLFRLLENERLPVTGVDADGGLRVMRVPDLRVAPPSPPVTGEPPAAPVQFGDLFAIRSLDVQRNGEPQEGPSWTVAPGDQLTVDIFWETLARPTLDYSVFLHLSAADDIPPVAQADSPMGGAFPTGAWRPDDLVLDQLTLLVPDDTPPGTYDLLLGVYFWQTGERLTATEDGHEDPDQRLVLGQVVVR